jgi:hypothetical protein
MQSKHRFISPQPTPSNEPPIQARALRQVFPNLEAGFDRVSVQRSTAGQPGQLVVAERQLDSITTGNSRFRRTASC